jgi:hypothetical protein
VFFVMNKPQLAHCNLDADFSNEGAWVDLAQGGRMLKLHFSRSPAAEWNGEMFFNRGGVRGKCKGFSFGSRRRLLDRLNCIAVGAALPQFLSLTLPDDVFCDSVGEFAKMAKHWLDTFLKRLKRACPAACGLWRIEWKARLSGLYVGRLFPHFHLLIWGLPERELCPEVPEQDGRGEWFLRPAVVEAYVDCADNQLTLNLLDLWSDASKGKVLGGKVRAIIECHTTGRVFAGSGRFVHRASDLESVVLAAEVDGLSEQQAEWAERARKMSFQDWASLAWYHVVDSHNLDHLQAGVRVERVKSWGGVMWYAAKYLSKLDAQFMEEIEWGRSWGIFNRECIPWAVMLRINLDNETGVRLRRVARRYLEHRLNRRMKLPYGVTVYCDTAKWRKLLEVVPEPPF